MINGGCFDSLGDIYDRNRKYNIFNLATVFYLVSAQVKSVIHSKNKANNFKKQAFISRKDEEYS